MRFREAPKKKRLKRWYCQHKVVWKRVLLRFEEGQGRPKRTMSPFLRRYFLSGAPLSLLEMLPHPKISCKKLSILDILCALFFDKTTSKVYCVPASLLWTKLHTSDVLDKCRERERGRGARDTDPRSVWGSNPRREPLLCCASQEKSSCRRLWRQFGNFGGDFSLKVAPV